jgi:hypothetical protein
MAGEGAGSVPADRRTRDDFLTKELLDVRTEQQAVEEQIKSIQCELEAMTRTRKPEVRRRL